MKTLTIKSILALLAALLLTVAAPASEMRPFIAGSHTRIVQDHAGKPFVLALWSLTCEPCHDELALFSRLLEKNPKFTLVLISTDTPADSAALTDVLARHRIARAENWVFADSFQEKLRFEIDRQWRGELPRTYLYSADGGVRAISGKLTAATLETWFATTTKQIAPVKPAPTK